MSGTERILRVCSRRSYFLIVRLGLIGLPHRFRDFTAKYFRDTQHPPCACQFYTGSHGRHDGHGVGTGRPALGRFKEAPYLSLLLSFGISIGLVCFTTSRAVFHHEQEIYAAVRLKQFSHNLQPFQFFAWIVLHCC